MRVFVAIPVHFASLALIGVALMGVVSHSASAQEYPARPIRLVIPFAAGGGTDTTARNLAAGLAKELGQQVVPDNRPGAAGNIAADIAVQSAPDGYTLLFGASVIATNVAFGPVPSFDPVKALQPISLIAKSPFLV
ncbi:MAG: tripartite tricarboxylate transporter substrate binding protein, partial [Betaproteobacteria bacterium]|nr:tripartite tricarboxylate transporter substrate binding protein [Betaproteobacteria bacterium]